MTDRNLRTPSLEEIEETEMALWIKEQLDRIRGFLTEREADTAMIEAVRFLIEDDERWIAPRIADELLAGNLRRGET
jgi:hypothetical protein